jgi:hypothetical protein
MQNRSQSQSQSCDSTQGPPGTLLGGGEDKRGERQKLLKELLDQPHQEKQQIRLSIQNLAVKALLIFILFGVCALFASADYDRRDILIIFLIASAAIVLWPFSWRES